MIKKNHTCNLFLKKTKNVIMNMFNRFTSHLMTADQGRHRGLHRQPDQIMTTIVEIHQIRTDFVEQTGVCRDLRAVRFVV